MTEKQRKELLRSQQGEIDAVGMYQALADAVGRQPDADTFRRLAAEEGRHGSIFKSYTGEPLKPKRFKAVLLPALYRLLGRERLYPLIARGEYSAAKGYAHLVPDFPEVESVLNDENRHGDTVMELLEQAECQPKKDGTHWKTAAAAACVLSAAGALVCVMNKRRK